MTREEIGEAFRAAVGRLEMERWKAAADAACGKPACVKAAGERIREAEAEVERLRALLWPEAGAI
jgi:hypothetical protein